MSAVPCNVVVVTTPKCGPYTDYGTGAGSAVNEPPRYAAAAAPPLLYGERQLFPNSCARIVVVMFSATVFLAGLGIVIFASLEKRSSYVRLCASCGSLFVATIVMGSVLMGLGLWGGVAAATRSRCVAILLAILLVLVGVVFLAVGTAAVVFRTDRSALDLHDLWNDASQSDRTAIEKDLGCEGYDSCEQQLRSDIDGAFVAIVAVAYSVMLVLFVCACSAVRMTYSYMTYN